MSNIQKSTPKRQITRKRQGSTQPAIDQVQNKLQQECEQYAQPPVSQGTREGLAILDEFAEGADRQSTNIAQAMLEIDQNIPYEVLRKYVAGSQGAGDRTDFFRSVVNGAFTDIEVTD